MSKIRKILLVCLVAICLSFCLAGVAACSGKTDWRKPSGGVTDDGSIDPNNKDGDKPFYYPDGTDLSQYEDTDNAYVIDTVSMGGLPVDGVRITVKDQSGAIVIEGISQNGGAKFGIPFGEYDLSYSNLPQGYFEDDSTVYHLTSDNLHVTSRFNSSVILSSMPEGWTYSLGSVMYNFRYTDGTRTMVLSELLETKKAVVLNFWATWCGPCGREFPALDAAYKEYQDDVEVIALSVEPNDTQDVINIYKSNPQSWSSPLSFFIAQDDIVGGSAVLASSLGGTASVPTTVIVDRYGIVASHHVGTVDSVLAWEETFEKYIADDYTQNLEQTEGGEIGTGETVAPHESLVFDEINDTFFNQAFVDSASIKETLHFYGPEAGSNDAKYNWPFQVAENKDDGMYITPTNIGTYTIENEDGSEGAYKTDNSWSIIYTDVTLDEYDTLYVDVKYNTESGYDFLYIIINESRNSYWMLSGKTDGWQTVQLYNADRPTTVHIAISYNKNTVGSPDDEFVGLKNLRVEKVNFNATYPIDLVTQVAREVDGEITSLPVYIGSDGFYRVQQGLEQNELTDSMLYTNVLQETLWSDRHLHGYTLLDDSGSVMTKSTYLISFWLFGSGDIDFGYGREYSSTIIDCFYVQDGSNLLAPVTEDIKEALDAFAQYAHNNSQKFKGAYDGEYDADTWKQFCTYYLTVGGDHNGKEADGETDHVCPAHNNLAAGRITKFAIPLAEGTNHIDTNIDSSVNFSGGGFYSLSAYNGAGVYSLISTHPWEGEGDNVDPYIYIWKADANPYTDRQAYVEQDESRGMDRFLDYSTNFKVYVYLEENETVYAQMTTRSIDFPAKYDVEVAYVGTEDWQLEVAATGDGLWVGTSNTDAVYAAIETVLVGGAMTGTHYHVTADGEIGSVIYIDFIRDTFMGAPLEKSIADGLFSNLSGGNYTAQMNDYLAQAKNKSLDDPTYGMIEANDFLVRIIDDLVQNETDLGEAYDTGYWKSCAYYWHYYGATSWEDRIV